MLCRLGHYLRLTSLTRPQAGTREPSPDVNRYPAGGLLRSSSPELEIPQAAGYVVVAPRNGDPSRHWAPLIADRGVVTVLREERELLAELARINTGIPALGLRIMEGSASPAEQRHYGEQLISAGQRLKRRADSTDDVIIDGDFHVEESSALPASTAQRGEPDRTS